MHFKDQLEKKVGVGSRIFSVLFALELKLWFLKVPLCYTLGTVPQSI